MNTRESIFRRPSRKDLVRGIAVAAESLALSACAGSVSSPKKTIEAKPTPTPEPAIGEAHLQSILEALHQSGYPLFRMAADHIRLLRTTTIRPLEFPGWIRRDSFPLRITTNADIASTANFIARFGEGPAARFFASTKDKPNSRQVEVEYVTIKGIGLSLPPHVRAGGFLAEGMYLVKEHLTLMVMVKAALELYDVMHPRVVQFTDTEGNPIREREKQLLRGASFYWNEMRDQNTDTWKVSDGLPTFLLAGGLDFLMQRGAISLQTAQSAIGQIYRAQETISSQRATVGNSIAFINGQWSALGTLLPPDGTTLRMFSESLFSTIKRYQTQQKR